MEYNFIYREKNGGIQLILSYKDNQGFWKQKSKQGFRTKSEAKKYQDTLLNAIREELERIDINTRRITVKDFKDIYFKDRDHLEANTLLTIRTALNKINALNDIDISEIGHVDISPIMNMLKKEVAPSTFRTNYQKLNSFFNYAINPYMLIKDNPMKNIEKPKIYKNKKNRSLVKDDLSVLLALLKENNPAYFEMTAIAAYTGMRFGEVLGLTWDDIDFLKKEISVNKQWGRTKSGMEFKKLKTDNSYRTVHCPQILMEILSEYKINCVINTSRRLFYRTNPSSTKLTRVYNKHGYDITFHDLRHTYATILISENVDIKTIAALLGDTLETVMEIYVHYNESMRQSAKSKIEMIF
jgi:integrase